MQAVVEAGERNAIAEGFVQGVDQGVLRFACVGAQAVHMAVVMALLDEASQCQLVERADGVRVEAELLAESLRQLRRQHQVRHAKRRAQAFCERVEVQHAFGGIDAEQRGDGSPGHAELRVVVVLDQIAVSFARPVQKLATSGRRGDDPGGELVRRHDVGNRCVGSFQRIDVDAGIVQPDMRHLRILLFIHAREQGIPWIFHCVASCAP